MAVPFTQYTISSSQYKVIRYTKRQKIQFEDTEQISGLESCITWIVELSGWKFKTTLINVLRDLKKSVVDMWDHTGDVIREVERKKPKEIPKVKNTVARRKDALMGSSIDWTQLKKELQNLKKHQ